MKKLFILLIIAFVIYKGAFLYLTIQNVHAPIAKIPLVERSLNQEYAPESVQTFFFEDIRFDVPADKGLFEITGGGEMSLKLERSDESSIFIMNYDDHLTDAVKQFSEEDAFQFLKTIYATTPSIKGFFLAHQQYKNLYLKTKLHLRNADKYAAVFEEEDHRGFQVCTPDLSECESTLIQLFIDDDPTNYYFKFFGDFTQDEIDATILSARKV